MNDKVSSTAIGALKEGRFSANLGRTTGCKPVVRWLVRVDGISQATRTAVIVLWIRSAGLSSVSLVADPVKVALFTLSVGLSTGLLNPFGLRSSLVVRVARTRAAVIVRCADLAPLTRDAVADEILGLTLSDGSSTDICSADPVVTTNHSTT